MDLYRDQLKKPHTSVVECDFDHYFDQQIRELEGTTAKGVREIPEVSENELTPPSTSSDASADDPLLPPPLPSILKGK